MSDNGCTANWPDTNCKNLNGCVRITTEEVHEAKSGDFAKSMDDKIQEFDRNILEFVKGKAYNQLGELAKQVIIRTMQEGETSHPANDFMDKPIYKHFGHAYDHMENVRADIICREKSTKENREELEHALTRIAIMLAKMEDL